MKYLGRFSTNGAPVCIATAAQAGEWTGIEGDYWNLINSPSEGWLSTFRAANGMDYLFFNLESDHYLVFQDEKAFLIVNVMYAARSYRMEDSDAVLSRHVDEDPLLALPTFGGQIILFDASLGHKELERCHQMHIGVTHHSTHPLSVVVLSIPLGTWQAYLTTFKDRNVSLCGVLFRLAG